jgi:hypothetical protein
MANIRITVDGNVLMDADPGTWSSAPPNMMPLQLGKPDPDPWMVAMMPTVAKVATEAMAGKKPGDITITVTTDDNGWTLDVEHSA